MRKLSREGELHSCARSAKVTVTKIFRKTDMKQSDISWYALRVFGNKVLKFRRVIEQEARQGGNDEVETYIPMTQVKRTVTARSAHKAESKISYSGNRLTVLPLSKKAIIRESEKPKRQVKIMRPLVASLMFIRCTEPFLNSLKNTYISDFSYYTRWEDAYPETYAPQDGKASKVLRKVAAKIPDDQMQAFIFLTKEDGRVTYLGEPQDIKLGDMVEVMEGPLMGRRGYVKRIKKDRKFLIVIGNAAVFMINTVNHKMLRRIEPNKVTPEDKPQRSNS